MQQFLKKSLIGTAVFFGIYVLAALVMIFWPAPTFAAGPFPAESRAEVDFTPRYFTTRDGETLFARHFPADSDLTILLLHGVTSESAAFNVTAPMLRELSGAGVVALDLRGHGQSGGAAGDVDYIGQYEDDVADVIAALRAEQPEERVILAGHSMGGGIALRFARLEDAQPVNGYLLFAPHLGTNAPTMPESNPETAEAAAAYSQLHVPRLIGLVMLNSVGIKLLNRQDTLFFNLTDDVTHTYTYRATVNTAPVEHGPALEAVDAPMLVVVGSEDEAFVADAFPAAIGEFGDGEVHIVGGETHGSIIESATAMAHIEQWLKDTRLASN